MHLGGQPKSKLTPSARTSSSIYALEPSALKMLNLTSLIFLHPQSTALLTWVVITTGSQRLDIAIYAGESPKQQLWSLSLWAPHSTCSHHAPYPTFPSYLLLRASPLYCQLSHHTSHGAEAEYKEKTFRPYR